MTAHDIEIAWHMRSQGLRWKFIAKAYGCNHWTLRSACYRHLGAAAKKGRQQ